MPELLTAPTPRSLHAAVSRLRFGLRPRSA